MKMSGKIQKKLLIVAAFRRTVGAPGQRSTSKRGFSKTCQQAIPTGAKGGVGRRIAHQANRTL